jgi:tetratricopeptide (TPR) repeat protein
MGLFRKPTRALDRLPSRFRPAARQPASGRPDAFSSSEPAGPGSPVRGPGNVVTVMIILLSGALLMAIVALWQTASGPRAANGATVPAAPKGASAEAIAAILSSARTYAEQQELGKSQAILDAAVAEHPDDQELRIALAETLLRRKQFGPAYDQYVRALEIGPREPKVEFVAGTLASQTGRPERAAEHYKAAQAADPGNAQYPLYLAQVQIKQNQLEDAKLSLLLSVRLDARNAVTWGTLADIFLRQNKLDMAIQNVQEARKLQPEVTAWKLIEARAKNRKGDAGGALLILSTLDRSEQRSGPVLLLMSECYGRLQRPADAAKLYADASDAQPTNAEFAYETAVWFDRAGDKDAALEYAARAAKLGHGGAADLLARLRS